MTIEKTTRCTRCAAEFTDADIEAATACPSCGSTGVPCAIKNDVQVTVNWHELRILVMWAENYEAAIVASDPVANGSSKGAIAAIAKRLMRFRPDGAPPLRFADEFAELQDHFPTTELLDGSGRVITPKRTLQ
jgi:predicted  nucleic acid-binding Zn-ribbon protein